jgi:hypothetical protein
MTSDQHIKEVAMSTQIIGHNDKENSDGFGTALNSSLVNVGEEFGLYEVISESGPTTSVELANRAGMPERHVRVWLDAQAAEDFVDHDAATGRYSLWCSWPRAA